METCTAKTGSLKERKLQKFEKSNERWTVGEMRNWGKMLTQIGARGQTCGQLDRY